LAREDRRLDELALQDEYLLAQGQDPTIAVVSQDAPDQDVHG
jgi:hypothetical protein